MGWLYALHARSSIARGRLWQLVAALVRSLDPAELWRAFGLACDRLLAEVDTVAPDLARRLLLPIRQLSVPRTTDARD